MQSKTCTDQVFVFVTMTGYDALTRWRNGEDPKSCNWVPLGSRLIAKLGYALLALIDMIEIFVRFFIGAVLALAGMLLSSFNCEKNLRKITGTASLGIGVSWLATYLSAGALFNNVYQSKLPISEKFNQK